MQLQTPQRLDTLARFGHMETKPNINGIEAERFVETAKAWIGAWSIGTTRLLEMAGSSQRATRVYITRSRGDWDNLTHLQLNGRTYRITARDDDTARTAISYDQFTCVEVTGNG